MCGITGFLDLRGLTPVEDFPVSLDGMCQAIQHRGPDDHGAWLDAEAGIALGFRRLAILDLTPTGHQPMFSADGRYVMVFNGEVYNFAQLRADLSGRGHHFRGQSDTEVMLAAVCEWGLVEAVRRFNGMFAFALWDRQSRQLHLVRDRLGIKPLYYGWVGSLLLFGSELKALRAHPGFRAEIDRDALALFLRRNYIPAPYSIYRGVHKLLPGCILTIDIQDPGRTTPPRPYWSARQVVEQGLAQPFEGGDAEAVAGLDALLRRSIGLRMIADVPLGAFLSGGVDSSAIVALMQAQSDRPVKTFTIGFDESGFDEAPHARAVAQRLGTEHTELYISPDQARAVIPLLPALYDEPFADVSQIPTFLVSQLARRHVTVSLSGDGGDEIFGGYNRHIWASRIWKRAAGFPAGLRRAAASVLLSIPPAAWTGGVRAAGWLLPSARHLPNAADKVQKLAGIISAANPAEVYLGLISQWKEPAEVVMDGHEPPTLVTDMEGQLTAGSFTDRMMYYDLVTYLPDDILVKVDRASMGVSLEARAPYLDDHELLEFAWKLPAHMKFRDGHGKWILRQVLSKYLPNELFQRPKMGFGVPIDTWLRGPLQNWAGELLDEKRLAKEGFFHPRPIQQKWAQHLNGSHNYQYELWGILMFQAWLEANS